VPLSPVARPLSPVGAAPMPAKPSLPQTITQMMVAPPSVPNTPSEPDLLNEVARGRAAVIAPPSNVSTPNVMDTLKRRPIGQYEFLSPAVAGLELDLVPPSGAAER
jgi:hypothetical protein